MYGAQLAQSVPALVDEANASQADVVVISRNVGRFGSFEALRRTVLDIRSRMGEGRPVVIALAGVNEDDRPMIAVATNASARSLGFKAGDLVRSASAVLGGGGGGKPDFAQGGGVDVSKVDEAIGDVRRSIERIG